MYNKSVINKVQKVLLALLILDVLLVTTVVLQMRFWEFAFSSGGSSYFNFVDQTDTNASLLQKIVFSDFLNELCKLRFGMGSGLIWGAYSFVLNIANTLFFGRQVKQAPLWISGFLVLCFNLTVWDRLGGFLSGLLTFLIFALLFLLFFKMKKQSYFQSKYHALVFFFTITNSILMLNSFQGYMRWLG